MTESTDTDAAAVDWQTRHDLLLDRYNRLAGEVATLHSTRMVLAAEYAQKAEAGAAVGAAAGAAVAYDLNAEAIDDVLKRCTGADAAAWQHGTKREG